MKFNAFMLACLVIGAYLGIDYWLGFQHYRVGVKELIDNHDAAMAELTDKAEIEGYIGFVSPGLLQERDYLRKEYLVYLGFTLLGVPKPTKKTLKNAYIALRGGHTGVTR